MKYAKPEINVLGDAAQLIQTFQKLVPSDIDGTQTRPGADPAYDLDE